MRVIEPTKYLFAAFRCDSYARIFYFHDGFISVTPMHVDLTRYQALEQVSGWLAAIETDMPEEPVA